MEPDDYQKAWKSQSSQGRVTVDADALLQQLQQGRATLQITVNVRDFSEVTIALLLTPVWLVMGYFMELPWTWYLMVPGILFVAGFLLAYRKRHAHKPIEPSDSLLVSAENSLTQVDDQIWLLRNVWWWYLAPFAIPMLVFFLHVSLADTVENGDWLVGLATAAFESIFVVGLNGFIYSMNRRVVNNQLVPRRDELRALLASLQDESTSELSGEYPDGGDSIKI